MHESALAGVQIDPALTAELLQRLAHRLPGDPEQLGQLTLHEVLAGLELAGDDELLNRLDHALTERGGTGNLGGRRLTGLIRQQHDRLQD